VERVGEDPEVAPVERADGEVEILGVSGIGRIAPDEADDHALVAAQLLEGDAGDADVHGGVGILRGVGVLVVEPVHHDPALRVEAGHPRAAVHEQPAERRVEPDGLVRERPVVADRDGQDVQQVGGEEHGHAGDEVHGRVSLAAPPRVTTQ
jgi:hypothetical protein